MVAQGEAGLGRAASGGAEVQCDRMAQGSTGWCGGIGQSGTQHGAVRDPRNPQVYLCKIPPFADALPTPKYHLLQRAHPGTADPLHLVISVYTYCFLNSPVPS